VAGRAAERPQTTEAVAAARAAAVARAEAGLRRAQAAADAAADAALAATGAEEDAEDGDVGVGVPEDWAHEARPAAADTGLTSDGQPRCCAQTAAGGRCGRAATRVTPMPWVGMCTQHFKIQDRGAHVQVADNGTARCDPPVAARA
jgi:hypothetical protein